MITLGGSTGFAVCPSTASGAMKVTPAAAATAFIAVRRDIACSGTIEPSEQEALHEKPPH